MKRLERLIIVALLIVSGCAGETAAQPPVSDALRRDAQAYAESHNVPLDEAIWRLRTQDPVGELQAVLQEKEADVFGGLWIEHEPVYKVIVLVTQGQRRIERRYVRGGPLADVAEVREAEWTLETLTAAQVKLPVCLVDTGPYPEAPPLDPPPGIVFPRQHPPEGLRGEMAALLIGELVETDGCLRVGDENRSHLIIWPYDHTVTAAADGTLQIRDGSGAVVAHAGDVVRMGGGEVPAVESLTSTKIPDRCGGPYWLAGSGIETVN